MTKIFTSSSVALVLLVGVLGSVAAQTEFTVLAANRGVETTPGPLTLDQLFLKAAVDHPEFGGMFLQDDTLMVYVVNPIENAADEAAIATIRGAIADVFGKEIIPRNGIHVLPAQYSFTQLAEWHNRIGVVFGIPGVILTDIDEAANRIKVGVQSANLTGVVEQTLTQVGIPRAAVNIDITQPVTPDTLQDFTRPLKGGLEIQFPGIFLCTLGFNAVRLGVQGFVTNSHCTNVRGGVEGTLYYQDSFGVAGELIGTESIDPLYTAPGCFGGLLCRSSDSAFVTLAPGVSFDQGGISQTFSGTVAISGVFQITSEGASLQGSTLVRKTGRTTGSTVGTVTGTCANVGVDSNNDRVADYGLLCQDTVTCTPGGLGVGGACSAPGDSGSPVYRVTSFGGALFTSLRGILFGGCRDIGPNNLLPNGGCSTIFLYSPIANIQLASELGPITTCDSLAC